MRRCPRLYVRLGSYVVVAVLTGFLVYFWCWSSCQPNQSDNNRRGLEKSQRHSSFGQMLLAILILTKADNKSRRNTLRNTWLRLRHDVFYKFVIGRKSLSSQQLDRLSDEDNTNGDILLLDEVVEDYSQLATKVLRSFKWVYENVDAKYVMKVDDDSFVSLQALHKELTRFDLRHKKASFLYWGFIDGRATPRGEGKWAEHNWRLCDRYLPHCLGGGYVLGNRLIQFIAENAEILRSYQNEDVAVGTWIASLNVHYWHDPRFDTEWKSRGCFNSYLVTHKQTDADMRLMYQNLVAAGHLCQKEYRERLSYEYNWSVPPSQCCIRNNSNIP